ncbi:MAG: response regulator [Cyanobacteria bacterium P01_F01_bin.53]
MQASENIKGDILIVDDTPENLRLLSSALNTQGYEVRAVLSGSMALSAAQTDPPDLILLDIKMPKMDGYEVCQRLKADGKTRDIPIIFLSALDDALDKVKAFNVGGVDYVTKPFQTAEVLARVKNQLTISFLRQKLLAQNEELLRSNQDLAEFSYVVSHDLKQPLQEILGFVSLLQIKYQETLDEVGEGWLNRIENAVEHMNELINDLLAYSRVGSQAKTLVPTDCNTILTQVLNDMQVVIEQHNATITYESLPTVIVNSVQLVELFQNLISNGIKFHRPEVTPQITIAAEQREQEWHFAVRDNGIGIHPKQFDRIFKVFQRVHSQKEYPGTGIGLSTCKKVVERHGGHIWVESTLGEGTAFYFTLPVSNQDKNCI